MKLPYRQVHLDFHTSEKIKGVGERFSAENFKKALTLGHVNSVTLFSKCHHGYSYHPTEKGEMHPELSFDLLKAQLEVCKNLGIRTPIYLSAGVDERLARLHPEWISIPDISQIGRDNSQPFCGFRVICFNTPYLDILMAQITEVLHHYHTDEIFLDIVTPRPCFCPACLEILDSRGQSPDDSKAVGQLANDTYFKYTRLVRETIDHINPSIGVFHNGGHIKKGFRELANQNSHLELESLPTGGWGYDHFPLSAAYANTLNMEYLGMTGKFHQSWGDFGTFKHPNALIYETSLSLAFGAKISVGDQLHPSGEMDIATYDLIGNAFSKIESKEKYCYGMKNIADVAILSVESISDSMENRNISDTGAARMLLEEHVLFDVIDSSADFSPYQLLILPDHIVCTGILKDKLKSYANKGGKLFASYKSATDKTGNYCFDFGCSVSGESEFEPSYIRPLFDSDCYLKTDFLMRGNSNNIENINSEVLALRCDPYFNRSANHFCSHSHTPNDIEKTAPAMVAGADGITIGFPIFQDYALHGHLILRKIFKHALCRLVGENLRLKTELISGAVTTLMANSDESRLIHHLLYAPVSKRGANVEIIEDLPPLYNVACMIKSAVKPKLVRIVPEEKALSFDFEGDKIRYNTDIIAGHTMIEIVF